MSEWHTKKILVVDDSAFMRQIVINSVKQAGFTNVIEAENGRDAIELYDAEHPDIILMDLIMPEVTGLQVLKTLSPKGAKIVVISAIGQKQIIDDAFSAGARGYLVKPFFSGSDIKIMVESVLAGDIVSPDGEPSVLITEYIEIARKGAEKSADALGRILGHDVGIVSSEVSIVDVTDYLNKSFEKDDSKIFAITGLLMSVSGTAYIRLDKQHAYALVDVLNRRDVGITTSLDGDIEKSTMEEVLNILSNSYLSVFNGLQIGMLAAELPHIIEKPELPVYLEKFLNNKTDRMTEGVVVFNMELIITKLSTNIVLEFIIHNDEIS